MAAMIIMSKTVHKVVDFVLALRYHLEGNVAPHLMAMVAAQLH